MYYEEDGLHFLMELASILRKMRKKGKKTKSYSSSSS